MASLSSAKTLGGVGGILVFIPGVSLVGWILILLATKEISESLNDKTIFDDALLGAITAVIGAVVFGALVFSGALFGAFAFGAATFIPFLVALGVFWIFTILSATFLKRSYEKIGQRLNVKEFGTAGSLYLIGAALTIVLVGLLIIFIALIFQVIAYWSIEDRPQSASWGPPTPQSPAPSTPAQQLAAPLQPPTTDSKFCPKCGTKLPKFAEYCTSCGAKQS